MAETPWKFFNHDHPQFPACYRYRDEDGCQVLEKQDLVDGDWQEVWNEEKRLVLLAAGMARRITNLRKQLHDAGLRENEGGSP